ncbi:PAP2 superfamily-domain-containing protein [Aspergillus pseudodeflectus]|uniref:PAP2 superfamily-domain-containing protein n=1 Tax=Aspergillus pseudodeflectus TaxID=176178 RepID=A0ABR4K0H7_9EURO
MAFNSLKALPRLPGGHASFSKSLFLSYILDWILIVGIALIGYGFHKVEPNHRPFSLTDASISFPHRKDETVRSSVMVVVGLIAPAVIIALASLLFTPGTSIDRSASTVLIWRRKLWEWNAGWLGLGLACAGVWMATEGLKDLYGQPRPDMLSRCDPDLSDIARYAVGGLGQRLEGAPTLVSWEICRNKADMLKYDGFASFPSGHASFSFAGLTYLSLWLCSKFSIKFPHLPHSPFSQDLRAQSRLSIRNQGAAPPIYLVIFAFVPWAVAFFVAASRWFDYRHHAFDIIIGSLMGIVFGWVGFRLYSPPITRGSGWSWGARSRDHAFFKAVGVPSNIGDDNWASPKVAQAPEMAENGSVDLESGRRNLAD